MHALESKTNFEKELLSLINKIDDRIATLSEMLTFHNGQNLENPLGKLNAIKAQRYKVKELLEKILLMNNEKWETNKNKYQEIFEEANKLLI